PGFVCVVTHILQERCSFFYTLWILLDNQHACFPTMIFVRKDTMFLALKKDQILNLMAMG
ncbi:hypothetical protein, partial [Geobacillus thermoleovorans]|uniref:hypothetical protein n=1 Tax=Geobacillus thermoleovorans TaxID=33941 RepID=UPI003DA6530E